MPGVSTILSATSGNGAWISTIPRTTTKARQKTPEQGDQAVSACARGGSWDDEDPAKLRVTARKASGPEWKIQDPQLPKSIWYHTDAQWLGFRVVRPLATPAPEQLFAYWNSGVEKDDPNLTKAE
jgi:hypothetical protein